MAVRQRPFTSLARNDPPALQLPAEPHDTELACTLLTTAVPGTCTAVCQVPLTAAGPTPAGTRVAAACPAPTSTSGQTAAVIATIMAAERFAAITNLPSHSGRTGKGPNQR